MMQHTSSATCAMSSSTLHSARAASTAVLELHRNLLRTELFKVAAELVGAPVQDIVSLDREGYDLAVITVDGRVVSVEDLFPEVGEDDPGFAAMTEAASFVCTSAYELECLDTLLTAISPVPLTSVLV